MAPFSKSESSAVRAQLTSDAASLSTADEPLATNTIDEPMAAGSAASTTAQLTMDARLDTGNAQLVPELVIHPETLPTLANHVLASWVRFRAVTGITLGGAQDENK